MGEKIENTSWKCIYGVGEKEEEARKENKSVLSMKEDLQVSFKHNPNNMKCGRPVRQGAKQARAIGKES